MSGTAGGARGEGAAAGPRAVVSLTALCAAGRRESAALVITVTALLLVGASPAAATAAASAAPAGAAAVIVAAPPAAPTASSAAAGAAAGSAPASGLRFVEVGATAGARVLHHTRQFGGPYSQVLGMFTNGGAAVAVGDYDGDGRDDLFLTDSAIGGSNHLLRNEAPCRRHAALPRRHRDRRGRPAATTRARSSPTRSGSTPTTTAGRTCLVARFGTPLLYRNLGGGQFREEGASAGLTAFANTIAVVAFDYDNDGRLDLLFGNYFQAENLLDLADRHVLPNNLDEAVNGGGVTLWHNSCRGGGGSRAGSTTGGWVRFADVTREAGLAGHTGWTLDVGHADLDNDGWQDLYLADDYGTDRLFWNQRDGTFADATAAAIGFDTRKGMNVDIADYNRDGWLDVYVTNITDDYMHECNMLWHNDGAPLAAAGSPAGRPTFTDVSRESGTCNTLWGWGAKWGDFDDDGWVDLFVADGLRSAGPEDYIPVLVEVIVRPGMDFTDPAA